ncbi:MAG: hypothetical protein Q7S40_09070 [Opitutaceae bacterium]|nr:hypothetical protein [Opitutaceae bacterium]
MNVVLSRIVNGAEFEGLEKFAAGRLVPDRQSCVLWLSDAEHQGYDTKELVRLISEYEKLPAKGRSFSFVLSPGTILISRALN